MEIRGFNKTTLLDYPGHLAATIFTGGCNFCCPFCYNGSLVLNPTEQPLFSEEEVLSVLEKRRNILEGVCITGGEPSLQADLLEFIRKIKKLGLKVKLDTNGLRPEVITMCLKEGILDYIAMDIKNSPEKYSLSTGIAKPEIEKIKESAKLLIHSGIEYEFRTTIVREHHAIEDMEEIGRWLQGASRYFLQSYQAFEGVIVPGLHAHEPTMLEQFRRILEKSISQVEIRGLSGDERRA